MPAIGGQAKNGTGKLQWTKRLPYSMSGRIYKATDHTDNIKLAKSLTDVHDVNAAPLKHSQRHKYVAIN
jgi:hypothetical protein